MTMELLKQRILNYENSSYDHVFINDLDVHRQKLHEKNGFVTATKLGTTNIFFVSATKNFAAATERFVDRTKHFVVVTKYFCYPYFNK